jgi:hypothetical protein
LISDFLWVLFIGMRTGRPPKDPKDLHTESMKIPLTAEEKREIEAGAQALDQKPVTWARSVLLKAAKRAKR